MLSGHKQNGWIVLFLVHVSFASVHKSIPSHFCFSLQFIFIAHCLWMYHTFLNAFYPKIHIFPLLFELRTKNSNRVRFHKLAWEHKSVRRVCWMRPLAHFVCLAVLTVASHSPVRSRYAGLEGKSAVPSCGLQQCEFAYKMWTQQNPWAFLQRAANGNEAVRMPWNPVSVADFLGAIVEGFRKRTCSPSFSVT